MDPALWDEARRGGCCGLSGAKRVFYGDGRGVHTLVRPAPAAAEVLSPNTAAVAQQVESGRVGVSAVLPQFAYPPYYFRPIAQVLGCKRVPLELLWDGPGTLISCETRVSRTGEVRQPTFYECPPQVQSGYGFQRFTLPPLKHRSALSYMVNYHAERAWVPERQRFNAQQGWREYVVPNHCGVQGKRNLFWLNRWVGDPVLLRWDWNQEPVGVQAFLFNPKGLPQQRVGFLTL